MAKGFM